MVYIHRFNDVYKQKAPNLNTQPLTFRGKTVRSSAFAVSIVTLYNW